jgi:POT family proton-dependent oligopeptide transporter
LIWGLEILPSQIQAANPLLIMLLTPCFSYLVYPRLNRIIELTALKKISIGLFVTAIAFSVSALLQMQIDAGQSPSVAWQLLAYVLLTSAEVMVSITGLEFSYTQAPKKLKSLVMALFFLSVAFGNLFTSLINFIIIGENGHHKLEGANYFWFFTVLMLITALLFTFASRYYQERLIVQDEAN